MKFDIELFRSLLLDLTERKVTGNIIRIDFDVESKEVPDNSLVAYHYKLMYQAGFVENFKMVGTLEHPACVIVSPLTFQGQEYVENARNETLWTKFKEWANKNDVPMITSITARLIPTFIKHFLLAKD